MSLDIPEIMCVAVSVFIGVGGGEGPVGASGCGWLRGGSGG